MRYTDEQLEGAARRLCELRGQNPDERIAHGAEPDARGFVPAVLLHSPAWKFAARELRTHLECVEALRELPVIVTAVMDGG